jgi:hypothetical protein
VELKMKTARRGVLYATAAFVAAGPLPVWFFSHAPKKPAHKLVVPAALAGPVASAVPGARAGRDQLDPLWNDAQEDPLELTLCLPKTRSALRHKDLRKRRTAGRASCTSCATRSRSSRLC